MKSTIGSVNRTAQIGTATTVGSHAGSAAGFVRAQDRLLGRFKIKAKSRFVDVPAIKGRAHVIVTGDGPPVMMVPGGGIPAAMWVPLMANLQGFTLHAVDLPGMGLTDPAPFTTGGMRALTVSFLEQVLDALGIDRCVFVASSMGALWTTWLALDRPGRVAAMVYAGCPALILGTSAPFPMRLMSLPPIGRLLMKLQPPSPRQVDRFAEMARESFSGVPEMRDMLLECERLSAFGPSLIGLLHSAVRIRGARPELALTAGQLAQLTQPVQIFWGERDPFGTSQIGQKAAATIADAELHITSGGHAPWFTQAARIAELTVPFLRRHSPARKPMS